MGDAVPLVSGKCHAVAAAGKRMTITNDPIVRNGVSLRIRKWLKTPPIRATAFAALFPVLRISVVRISAVDITWLPRSADKKHSCQESNSDQAPSMNPRIKVATAVSDDALAKIAQWSNEYRMSSPSLSFVFCW